MSPMSRTKTSLNPLENETTIKKITAKDPKRPTNILANRLMPTKSSNTPTAYTTALDAMWRTAAKWITDAGTQAFSQYAG
jgi:hypothetical protein